MNHAGREEHEERVCVALPYRGPGQTKDIARDETAHGSQRLSHQLMPEFSIGCK